MATLYLYSYNNYYNRRLKKEADISGYGTPVYLETGDNLNFNPNDGVNTQFIAGRYGNPYNASADYAIYSEDNTTITSRWFIIEQTRNLKGQYNLTLRRDLLADFKDNVYNADAFIEKATLTSNNPLIYNQEAMTVNQIKSSETLLKDETGIAWLCGYIARNTPEKQITIAADVVSDYSVSGISSWEYYPNTSKYINGKITGTYLSLNFITEDNTVYYPGMLDINLETLETDYTKVGTPMLEKPGTFIISQSSVQSFIQYITSKLPEIKAKVNKYASLYIDNSNYNVTLYNELLELDGKVVYDQNSGLNYSIGTTTSTESLNTIDLHPDKGVDEDGVGVLNTWLYNLCNASGLNIGVGGTIGTTLTTKAEGVKLTLTQIPAGTYKVTIREQRIHLKDAPYDMFCIPYPIGYDDFHISNQYDNVLPFDTVVSHKTSLLIAQGIAEELGDFCYDVQLLPYCPLTGLIIDLDNHKIDVNTSGLSNTRVQVVQKETQVVDCIIWAAASSGTKNIPLNISVSNKKMENETDLYRLVSPNYNGQFEFSAAKNDGVEFINVDYTYLPYNPYIHLNPNFKNLYGEDYNDARGLIIKGDFSIARISNAWTNYTVQNKNYDNIFGREIQNMETNRKYEKIQQAVGAGVGALSSGVNAGLLTGNVFAGVGAGMASLAGGLADMAITDKLHNEALDYKKDMFGYQLDNIKALPYSISKTTAYTYNNKIFPIIEYYTCTDEEKKAFANKIAWNGMTVGVIDKIINYAYNTWSYKDITDKGYIKARLIRVEGIDDDTNLLNSLADEVFKGFYTK